MSAPLTVKRNNYHKNIKKSTIYTPPGICQYLFDRVKDIPYIIDSGNIFDPRVGTGNLLKPFLDSEDNLLTGYGIDIKRQLPLEKTNFNFTEMNFLEWDGDGMGWGNQIISLRPIAIDLVIMNPPLNADKKTKEYLKSKRLGKSLVCELFIDHVFRVFGERQPLITIVPMGFRLNQRKKSKRWKKYRDREAKITGIVSLPLDVFTGVEFHMEILFFNIPIGNCFHDFLPDIYL